MQASQAPVALVTARIEAAALDGRAYRAAGFLQMLTVDEAAADGQLVDFREAEAARLEAGDGRRKVAHAGRIDDRAAFRQIVKRRARGGVTPLGVSVEFARGDLQSGYEARNQRRFPHPRLADEHAGFTAQLLAQGLKTRTAFGAAADHRVTG